MSSVFVPYLERPDTPRSSDLTVLRTELHRCRAIHGRRSDEAAQAFAALTAAAAAQGRPLDQLDTFITDETERFMSMTVAGTAGHTYWNGTASNRFTRNGGRETTPRIWWWLHAGNPPLRGGDSIIPTCDERHCINPRHCKIQDRRARAQIYTDEQMLGAIQVMAMRLGHSPSTNEWQRNHGKPWDTVYVTRFGSWNAALRAAGLALWERPLISADSCRQSLLAAHNYLGHVPTSNDYLREDLREHLSGLDLPRNVSTIKRRLGSWADAIKDTFG